MKRLILTLTIFSISLFANEIFDEKEYFKIKIENSKFENLYMDLKDEISYNAYTIVHELNLGKSTQSVAEALNKKAVVKNGINLMICKSSFTLQMHEDNMDNMTFCPMVISIYEDEKYSYVGFRKYHPLKEGDKVANEINERLKSLILKSVD